LVKNELPFLAIAALILASCGGGDPSDPAAPPRPTYIYALGQCTTQPGNHFDMRLKKYDSSGAEITAGWDKLIDNGNSEYGNNDCMGADSAGNIYFAYQENRGMTNYDWRIRKFSPSGDVAPGWDKTFDGGESLPDYPYSLLVDSSDNVYVIGMIGSASADNEWRIKKYLSDGTEVIAGWDKTIGGGSSDVPFDAALGSDGSLYVMGMIDGSYLVRKYFSNGSLDSSYSVPLTASGSPQAIALDYSDQLYVAGYRFVDATRRLDWSIKKYSSTGEEITTGWDKTIDGGNTVDELRCIAVDKAGNLYAAGLFDTGSASTAYSPRIIKFKPDGSTDWAKTLADAEFRSVNSMSFGPGGEAYVIGTYGALGGLSLDWRIAKFSSEGVEDASWSKTVAAGTGQPDCGQAILAVF
jgi:hypothetical protein